MAPGRPFGAPVPQISYIDLSAFAWFAACWIGYTLYSDRAARKGTNLVGAMARQREAWMRQMVGRENRMVDLQILRLVTRTSSFFASTSMLILAGLVTVLGAMEKTVRLVATVPLVSELTPLQWEIRLLLLTLIFVYTFFKFSWSIRQLTYCSIQVGAMEPSTEADGVCLKRSASIARIATLAASHFNRGLRGYYFAAALAASFIHPIALVVAATWVVLVLYRREFHSNTLAMLRDSEAAPQA
jgi:uncharacterized membrane protein